MCRAKLQSAMCENNTRGTKKMISLNGIWLKLVCGEAKCSEHIGLYLGHAVNSGLKQGYLDLPINNQSLHYHPWNWVALDELQSTWKLTGIHQVYFSLLLFADCHKNDLINLTV